MTLRPAYAIFSLNSFIAAMLALYIGFSVDLPRPYWAMLTVYIVAQPLTGALRSKAMFRAAGTLLGATVAVALVPVLVNAPILLSLAMAGWAGLCLYLSLLDRTPRSYIFMLAGYTAAIIGFPSVTAPGEVFETAVARVEEITLGIVCATVVHTILFPRDVGTVLRGRIANYLADAQRWVSDALLGLHGEAEELERQRLAADVTELQILATHLPFDTSDMHTRARALRVFQDQLSLLLPLLSAVEDRLAGLQAADGLSPEISKLVAEASAWAKQTRDSAGLDALQVRCAALLAEMAPAIPANWKTLLQASVLTRLSQLIATLQASRDLGAFITDRDLTDPPSHLKDVLGNRLKRPLHRDHGLAGLSAIALMAAVLSCCIFWIATGWPEGSVAAMMAAVFSSFFATQDDPAPALFSFMGWTVVSLPVAALYLFGVLPAIDGFPLLAVVLAPVFLFIGYLQADPRHFGKAIPLILGIAGSLSLQEVFSADFPGFVNTSLAQIVGIGAALTSTQIFRSLNAGWSAQRILRHGWRDIALLAATLQPADRASWTSAMLDRLGLLTSRLPVAELSTELEEANAVADLRVGLNIIDLTLARQEMDFKSPATNTVLERLSGIYASRAAGRHSKGDGALLTHLDAAMREINHAPEGAMRMQALVALTGLRRTLFPGAAGFLQEVS